jgi:hypothetical protein
LKYIGLIITLFVFIVCLFVAIYEKDSDDSMNAVAGLIRSFGRTAARALPKAGLGSFPMHGKNLISAMQKSKISVRTIGKYA